MHRHIVKILATVTTITSLSLAVAGTAAAQVTPAAGYTPPDDTPSIKVGATIFTDYTYVQKPQVTDANGDKVSLSGFNVGRAYINITGNVSHLIAFRITPDIVRETGTGSSVAGSYTFRLKYAFAQVNLDDWMNKGSWIRLGMQQTPWVDFMENVYRYRFQGQIFEDREGYLSSSDIGASFHYTIPNNYGDIHTGIYNGETYSKPEVNNQKGYMIRGTFRPLPMSPTLRGLRVTGFYDADAYVQDAERHRGTFALTYEHKYVNASYDYLWASDQPKASATKTEATGYSIWVTPKTTMGVEGLLRFDHLDSGLPGKKDRTIGGISYWFPHQGNVSTALLFDVETVNYKDYTTARDNERRIALHALINF